MAGLSTQLRDLGVGLVCVAPGPEGADDYKAKYLSPPGADVPLLVDASKDTAGFAGFGAKRANMASIFRANMWRVICCPRPGERGALGSSKGNAMQMGGVWMVSQSGEVIFEWVQELQEKFLSAEEIYTKVTQARASVI